MINAINSSCPNPIPGVREDRGTIDVRAMTAGAGAGAAAPPSRSRIIAATSIVLNVGTITRRVK